MDFEVYLDDLPPVLQLMAESIGLANCLRIVELFGGSRLIVPVQGLAPTHELRKFLSDDECDWLKHYFVGCVEIPCAKSARVVARDREIWRDARKVRNPLSVRELSMKYDLTERQINKSILAYEHRVGRISDLVRARV